jgi:hypothetical protein
MNACGITARQAPAPLQSARRRQARAHLRRHLRQIGAARQALLEQAHHLSDVLRRGGRGGGDRGVDLGGQFLVARRLRQVAGEHVELELLARGQVVPAGLLVLFDGVAALLAQPLDDGDRLRIVELDALVDLLLAHGGDEHADRRQAIGSARAHRGFHVLADSVLQAHGWDLQMTKPASGYPGGLRLAPRARCGIGVPARNSRRAYRRDQVDAGRRGRRPPKGLSVYRRDSAPAEGAQYSFFGSIWLRRRL